MKKKYQNGFFIFGLTVLVIMVSQLDFHQVWQGINRAGYWFLAVILLWFVLYIFNTSAWWIIIRSLSREKISFWWLYKVTVSGFALNYATPGGMMGGEPYRVMSLAPKIGTEKASASVILYDTHLLSLLVLVALRGALPSHPTAVYTYDYHAVGYHCLLHPGHMVFHQRI